MDKYDEAVAYLTKHPSEIVDAWGDPQDDPHGCLFGYCGPKAYCGCLTQVRIGHFRAATTELTMAIRNDYRIPRDPTEITTADLPVFAEWQRRIDAMEVR